MRLIEPSVHIIAKTMPIKYDLEDWLRGNLSCSREYTSGILDNMGIEHDEDVYPYHPDLGADLIRLCGKRCYMSFEVGMNANVTKVRDDLGEFIDNILKVGHGSVLEHINYTFAIENVSRVFTGEMNRHRAGMAISEGSMRYIRFDDIKFWMPHIFRNPVDEMIKRGVVPAYVPGEYDEKNRLSQQILKDVFSYVEMKYQQLCEIWKEELDENSTFKQKKMLTSAFRRIIPMGVATGGIWTGNIRALRHIFTMRCDAAAEEEIMHVASMMLEKIIKHEPTLFKDFEKANGHWQPKYRKV